MVLNEKANLAYDVLLHKCDKRVPSWLWHTMQHDQLEYFAGVEYGEYEKKPEEVYLKFQSNIGTCLIDQYIPLNPLKMGNKGFKEGYVRGATTGLKEIYLDGMLIDSPEAVVEHMEKFVFPNLVTATENFQHEKRIQEIIEGEKRVQEILKPDILKTGYGFIGFPAMAYGAYGYENYLMAYALYPEIIEKHFALQADYCLENNKAAAIAYKQGNLPPLFRLDHDMADGRGTLVDIKSLDRIWFPHFARCLEPVIKSGVNLIWHCDGNLMQMVPRLIDVGINGFQGFQYEFGMDYEKICKMKTREGENLIIIAGVSVTRTLPYGTPEDVKKEIRYLVENGPETGLFLACTSSITPGVPLENLKTMVEGFRYYREHGRDE